MDKNSGESADVKATCFRSDDETSNKANDSFPFKNPSVAKEMIETKRIELNPEDLTGSENHNEKVLRKEMQAQCSSDRENE